MLSLPGHFPFTAIAPAAIAITTSVPRFIRPFSLPGGATKDTINVPTHATHTTAPISRKANVRWLGHRHATAIIAGNNEVPARTKQISSGVCRKNITTEKATSATAKTKQSQPAMSDKILRDELNSETPGIERNQFCFGCDRENDGGQGGSVKRFLVNEKMSFSPQCLLGSDADR